MHCIPLVIMLLDTGTRFLWRHFKTFKWCHLEISFLLLLKEKLTEIGNEYIRDQKVQNQIY